MKEEKGEIYELYFENIYFIRFISLLYLSW
jgi:hypothetical protein